MGREYGVPGLSKGIALIELLCESSQPLGVSEISKRLDLNKHMVFRLLQTLIDQGWVVQEGEGPKYRMSLVPFHHTSKPVSRMDLVQAATEPLNDLWRETNESIGLGILDETRIVYVAHLNGTRDIAISGKVGTRYLLYCSAPGKVLLAYNGDPLVERVVKEGLVAMTPNTITTAARLRRELETVCQRGFAVDSEEYARGCLCYSVPVYNYAGRVVAALNISVLDYHHTQDDLVNKLGPKVAATAERISLVLGYSKEVRKDGDAGHAQG